MVAIRIRTDKDFIHIGKLVLSKRFLMIYGFIIGVIFGWMFTDFVRWLISQLR